MSRYHISLLILLLVTVIGSYLGQNETLNYLYLFFIIAWVIFTAKFTGMPILEVSGINLIEQKLMGNESAEIHSSFFIWFFAIYVGLFGLSSQRYESSFDRLQLQETIFDTYISSGNPSFAFEMIPKIQKSLAPIYPSFHLPLKTIYSFFSKRVKQKELVNKTKRILSSVVEKDNRALERLNLRNINLSEVKLQGGPNRRLSLVSTDIRGADFSSSTLRNIDFSHAIVDLTTKFENSDISHVNLTKIKNVLEKDKVSDFAKNLCKAKLIETSCGDGGIDPSLKSQLKNLCPDVFSCIP